MTAATIPLPLGPATPRQRLVRAWVATGTSDFVWAVVLTLIYHRQTIPELWRGVAAVPFGKWVLDAGVPGVFLGVATHFGVAFCWSALFLMMYLSMPTLRQILDSRFGTMKVAAVYGPMIWIIMSRIAIPLVSGNPAPTLTYRWWIQLAGHVVFVGFPLVWGINRKD